MKRILFIAPSYLDLYKLILKELQVLAGNQVDFIPAKHFDSPYYQWVGHKTIRQIWFEYISKPIDKYWKEQIKQGTLSHSYDECFIINGEDCSSYLLKHLRKKNMNIKIHLYVWDSSNWFDYYRHQDLYDSIHTFDMSDADKYEKAEYLPFFIPREMQKSRYQPEFKYKISCIGTDHDGRAYIIRNFIIPLCEQRGWSYYFKLMPFFKEQLEDNNDNLFIEYPINADDYNTIMEESECVLDIDRPMQTALTPRFVWALAAGKKIITSNQNYRRLLESIVSKDVITQQVKCIDVNKPILDVEFMNKKLSFSSKIGMERLYIQNWVNTILYGKE